MTAQGHLAVLTARASLGEPEWAADLVPCSDGLACPARIELIDVVETLRHALHEALQGRSGASRPP